MILLGLSSCQAFFNILNQGPIIRINPWEVHISDPEFYDVAYSSAHFDKKKAWENRLGVPNSVLSTTRHDLHHRRRVALNPYFSKRRVLDFSNQMQSCVERLCDRLVHEYSGSSKVLNLNHAWAAYAMDTVTFYVFARSYDYLSCPDFFAPFITVGLEMTHTIHIMSHFPWVMKILQSIPDAVVGLLNPTIKPWLNLQSVSCLDT